MEDLLESGDHENGDRMARIKAGPPRQNRPESGQAVPGNVEVAVIESVDRLMKHVAFVDIVAVRQAGSNGRGPEQYGQDQNRPPAGPVKNTALWRRLAR